MFYELKAGLLPTSTFSDTGFSFKNTNYSYSDIVNFSVTGAATALTNGVIQITVKGASCKIQKYIGSRRQVKEKDTSM